MFYKNKKKERTKINKEYPYLDLLSDNSPQAFEDYYEDAAILDKQIKEPNVYNIAIVAKYGAGKSSVINTYLKRYRDKKTRFEKRRTKNKQLARPESNKYTRISLSTFNKNDYNEVAIERSILQQLLYSRKKTKLPNSKIERTNKSSKLKSILFALLLTVFMVSTVLMAIEFSLFGRDIATAGATSLFDLNWIKYALLGVSTLILFFLVLWVLHYRKLRKIKYKDLEADITQDDEHKSKQVTNLINKFIDEVLYFFECIDIDLVIFEDLDRLPTTEIFVKLRELNTIINSSSKRAKKVTFLYAVKDELFKNEEERAKFFEFILPVVPVINPVTTKSEIESRLKTLTEINPEMNLTGKFIKGISTYIPDMRILKNTFNDYIIMFHKIFEDKNASKKLKADNLFALCLYKNLFPYDYALLEKGDGLIPLVVDIELLQEKCLAQINDKIKELNKQLAEIQNETTSSFEELRGIFISQIHKCKKVNRAGSINPWNITTFKDIDFSKIQHPYVPNGEFNQGYAILLENGTEVLTPKGKRFIDVENAIKLKEQNAIEKLKKELAALEKQRQFILSWGLAQIVSRIGINSCFPESIVPTIKKMYEEFSEEEIPDKKIKLQIGFLRFLVAQDYIDEHYIEYTSNYKADILSPADIKVVQAIQSGQENFDVSFENLSDVIRWLNDEDFNRVSIINKAILDNVTLIKDFSQNEKDKKFDNLITLLADTENPDVLALLQKYIATADVNNSERLLEILIPKRCSLCSEVMAADVLSNEKKDFVLVCHIKYTKEFIKLGDIISSYISSHHDYLRVFSCVSDENKVIDFLDHIQPSFSLYNQDLNGRIHQHIIQNCYYEMSVENLEIIYNVDKTNLDDCFYTKNYETISSGGNTYVRDYIERNINTYVTNVLLNSKITCEKETMEVVDRLLKNKSVASDAKFALIAKIDFEYDSIKELDAELFETLFENGKVVSNWTNIQFAYEQKGFKCVENFIRSHKKISGQFVGCEGIGQDTPTKLVNEILVNYDVEEISSVAGTLPAVTMLSAISDEVSDVNLAAYISKGRIKFCETDLYLLFEKSSSLCNYIRIYSQEILEKFDTFFEAIIPQKIIQRQQVLEGGHYVYKNVITGYSEKAHMQNLLAVILKYKGIDIKLKQKLIESCLEVINIEGNEQVYADYIISEAQALPPRILWQFSKASLSVDVKLSILAICNYGGEHVDVAKLKEYLISMGGGYAELFDGNKNATIVNTESNKNLLDALCVKKLIKSYKKVRNKEEYKVIAS